MADRCRQHLGWAVILLLVSAGHVQGQELDAAQQAFQQGYAYQTGSAGAGGTPDLDLALRYYAQALRLRPRFYEAHANAGQIYYQRRDYRRAKYHLSEAIRLARGRQDISPAEEARISSDLGSCYFQEGELTEAERWLRGAIGLAPTLVEAHYNLINLLLRQDRIEAARQHLARAQQQAPSDRYGIFIGRLKTKESYADWNPTWLKVVVGLAAVAGVGFVVFRSLAGARGR